MRKDLVEEKLEWRDEVQNAGAVGKYQRKWQTFTQVTRTTTKGGRVQNVEKFNKDVKNHSETRNIYGYNKYKVLYFVSEYRYVYKCLECGYEETRWGEELEEKDRKYDGSYTERG